MALKTPSQQVADFFYKTIDRRPSAKQFTLTIGQANALFREGYTQDEIEMTIKWCKNNPARDGFYSLGFVTHVIKDVLKRLKAEKIKDEQKYRHNTNLITSSAETNKAKTSKERVNRDFNFNDFE